MNTNDLDLVIRSLDDDLNAEETAHLQRLLRLSPEARNEMDGLHALRHLVAEEGAAPFAPHFADRVMQQVAPRTSGADSRASAEQTAAARFRAAWQAWLPERVPAWSLALGVALVLVGVGLALWPKAVLVTVPYGEQMSMVLPDGSSVELGSGSTLRYTPFQPEGTRAVQLEGEAFFKVVKEARPFVVETFNARIAVKGTRFNVEAWQADATETTVVTLASGSVELAPRTPHHVRGRLSEAVPVQLAPGQTSVVMGDTAAARTPVAAQLSRVLAWRSGGLAFADQPLGSVAQALERRYDVEIALASSELAGLPIAYFNPNPGSAASVLDALCHIHGLRFQRTSGGFVLSRE
ncbi:MAG: FecR domain-containing protein [Rhodothermales bacterium]